MHLFMETVMPCDQQMTGAPHGRGCCAEFPSKAELQGREHPVPGTPPLRAPNALVS